MPLDTPRILRCFPNVTLVVVAVLSGLGIASSCASSPRNPATPAPLIEGDDEPADAAQTLHTHEDQPEVSQEDSESPESVEELRPADPLPNPDQDSAELLAADNRALLQEMKALYRRLHIELSPERRSELIVELLRDPRTSHQLLGFELADRDLSASVSLSDAVGQAVRELLQSESPQIRAQSARLITRISPPDAMLALTNTLRLEESPIAAEPMLLGIARWPNAEAKQSVLHWIGRQDAPLFACFSAAWSMEREGIWDPETDYPKILSRLRDAEPASIREAGMKLMAKLGSADDLRRLIGFMLSEDTSTVNWAATALVETPRAVEELVAAATKNATLYQAAAESLIQHRATPEGLRRLSEIPQPDPQLHRDMLLRMGRQIDRDQLGEAVRLAELPPEMTMTILSRLVNSEEPHTARTVRGVLHLAELQLQAGRPNRVIEALLSLEGAPVDPADQARLIRIRSQALLLLARFDDELLRPIAPDTWILAIEQATDHELKARIANELHTRAGDSLDEAQRAKIQHLLVEEEAAEPTKDDGVADE